MQANAGGHSRTQDQRRNTVNKGVRFESLGGIAAELNDQFRSNIALLLMLYIPIIVTLGALVALWFAVEFPAGDLFRDPIAIGRLPIYSGVLSNVGALIWCASAAVCLFAYFLSRHATNPRLNPTFLLAAGLITTMLLIDDFFMLHDFNDSSTVVPFEMGYVLFTSYAVAFIWFLTQFRATILRTEYLLLALALAGIAVSLFVDSTAEVLPWRAMYLFEDGSKLAGIVSWAAYLMKTSALQLRAQPEVARVVETRKPQTSRRSAMGVAASSTEGR